jgi:hypothetical protein
MVWLRHLNVVTPQACHAIALAPIRVDLGSSDAQNGDHLRLRFTLHIWPGDSVPQKSVPGFSTAMEFVVNLCPFHAVICGLFTATKITCTSGRHSTLADKITAFVGSVGESF